MANIKFELNLPGLNELMKSPEMQAALDAAGAQVKDTIASTLVRLKAAIDAYINPEA